MATFTGTNANESITPTGVSATVTRDPEGSFPGIAVDTIDARAGDDYLDGGGGADQLTGGAGDDNHFVDNVNDTVIEKPNEGTTGYFEGRTDHPPTY